MCVCVYVCTSLKYFFFAFLMTAIMHLRWGGRKNDIKIMSDLELFMPKSDTEGLDNTVLSSCNSVTEVLKCKCPLKTNENM